MARRHELRIGDRVSYPENPDDTGTIMERNGDRQRVIVWDRFSILDVHFPDIDECTKRGRMVTGWDGFIDYRPDLPRLTDEELGWLRRRVAAALEAA